jgi:hypothetical protein
MCPDSKMYFSSVWATDPDDAIDLAVGSPSPGLPGVLGPGDVLVVECQVYAELAGLRVEVPAELDPQTRASILYASDVRGITVVEAAGNSRIDLKNVQAEATTAGVDPHIWGSALAANESLAVIVGAGEPGTRAGQARARYAVSNYGLRVSCQGWGSDVQTTGLNNGYSNFSGTSSATAMIAGVAALLQCAVKRHRGYTLHPEKLRSLLADPLLGLPQTGGTAAAEPIGPLPDLARLLEAAADVYLRDNLGDTGIEPSTDLVFWSPDIIVSRQPLGAVDAEQNFGAGVWGSGDLGDAPAAGRDNHVWLRVQNRGLPATNATVSLYYSRAATFIHPEDWKPIAVDHVVGPVESGEHRLVGPLLWAAANVPPRGHYCLIAVVRSPLDSVDLPGSLASTSEYSDFLRAHNNICHRNVQVVDESSPVRFPFLLRGHPSRSRVLEEEHRFRLEVHHALPAGSRIRLSLDGPSRSPVPGRVPGGQGRSEGPIEWSGPRPLVVEDIGIPPGGRLSVLLEVVLAPGAPRGRYQLSSKQYFGRKLLGRVNHVAVRR